VFLVSQISLNMQAFTAVLSRLQVLFRFFKTTMRLQKFYVASSYCSFWACQLLSMHMADTLFRCFTATTKQQYSRQYHCTDYI